MNEDDPINNKNIRLTFRGERYHKKFARHGQIIDFR